MEEEHPQIRELNIKKTLNVPVELVWEVWTNPKDIVNWWAPTGFTTTIHRMDLTEDGEWLMTLHGPDGKRYPNKSIFKEIIPLKYGSIDPFHDGLAVVQQNGKYGFIDKRGNLVIPFKYEFAVSFSHGLAVVTRNGKRGYIDKTGKCVWKPTR